MSQLIERKFILDNALFERVLLGLKNERCFAWEALQKSHSPSFSESSHQQNRYSLLGIAGRTISLKNDQLLTWNAESDFEQISNEPTCPFELLEAESNRHLDSLPGGILGFFSYDCARRLESVSAMSTDPSQPQGHFIFPLLTLLCDHQKEIATLSYSESIPKPTLSLVLELIEKKTPTRIETNLTDDESISITEEKSELEFIEMVGKAKEYILDGDCFQVVLSNSFESKVKINPIEAYLLLRKKNPSAYHFLLSYEGATLVGASPETMLRSETVDGETEIIMRPVAGTYPVKNGDLSPQELAENLSRDPKEHAEHIMLVDHSRNDIGRSAQATSVYVKELLAIETYQHLHHLVSEVRGKLAEKISVISALKNAFPIATLVGTPKIRAMEIIAELEKTPRGIFGGAAFFLKSQNEIDSTVVIRSMIIGENKVRFQAGAGIVVDSQPQKEYRECLLKTSSQREVIKDLGQQCNELL